MSEPTLYRKRCGHQPGTHGKVHGAHCFMPVELYPQQWCETHDTIANCEEGDPDCVLVDTAPTLYVVDPDPMIGGSDG